MKKLKWPPATVESIDMMAEACGNRWWAEDTDENIDNQILQWAVAGNQLDILMELRMLDEKTRLVNEILEDRGFKQRIELPRPVIYEVPVPENVESDE
jgi:hypothetical protein